MQRGAGFHLCSDSILPFLFSFARDHHFRTELIIRGLRNQTTVAAETRGQAIADIA